MSYPIGMHDPFNETFVRAGRRRFHLLGGLFEFESNSSELLELVDEAYAGLRPQRLARDAPRFKLRLVLVDGPRVAGAREPPPMRMQGGAGFVHGAMDEINCAIVHPGTRTGLVTISRDLLRRFRYHARYEVLEFAVFVLASRAQNLMSLHAGCVGSGGAGLILLGDSGAGKSTLALQCLLNGMDLIAEDAVFVQPGSWLATGVPTFLHLEPAGLKLIADASVARRVRQSPVIRRRSGAVKYELDLRRKGPGRIDGNATGQVDGSGIARGAQQVVGLIFVSKRRAASDGLLEPLSTADCRRRLRASQDYAAGLPGWVEFERSAARLAAFELRRGASAADGAKALRGLIEWGRHRR